LFGNPFLISEKFGDSESIHTRATFLQKKSNNLKSPNFSKFLEKPYKIQILDSQLQQKIVAF